MKKKTWSKAEIKYLQNCFASESKEDLVLYFNRTWSSIHRQACKRGLRRDQKWLHVAKRQNYQHWSDEEIKYLKDHFENCSKYDMVQYLGRSWQSIGRQAKTQSLTRSKDQKEWTLEEDNVVRAIYPQSSAKDILSALSRWSWLAVRRRAISLGVQRDISLTFSKYRVARDHEYATEEIDYIKKYYSSMSKEDLVLHLNREWRSIQAKGRALGFKRVDKIRCHGERLMKRLLDRIYPNESYIDRIRPDWLKNPRTGYPLELDRFYPNLNLAFEYNGPQHYKPSFSEQHIEAEVKQVQQQKIRDQIKLDLCCQRGIRLVVFKYTDHLSARGIKEKINMNSEEVETCNHV